MDVERRRAAIGSRLSSLWLARRCRRRGRRRLNMDFIQLIVLCARLRQAKDRCERTKARKSAKPYETAQPVLIHVLGMCPHAAPQKIEGDITIIGAPLLSVDCHSSVAHCCIRLV
jgi:hypothetical protein